MAQFRRGAQVVAAFARAAVWVLGTPADYGWNDPAGRAA